MKASLRGVHSVNYRASDGTIRTYHYAWRGGPRMKFKPGSKEFLDEYLRLTRHRKTTEKVGTFGTVIAEYHQSPEYTKLSASSRRSYEAILHAIRHEYGNLPIPLLEKTGMRRDFLKWRDTMADRPRTADLHIAVLKRVLSWAVDHEIITMNKLAGAGRLHSGDRRELIWQPDQIAALQAAASPQVALAFRMALHTGQRQGDLLRLGWPAYQAGVIRLKQSKTGAMVAIKLPADLATELDAIPRTAVTILTNSRGTPWTTSGFRASWNDTVKRAGISGLTFHDLRGTFITTKYREGWTINEITQASGHMESAAEEIIRKHYLAVDVTRTNRA
jgi:integrase